MPGVLVVGGGHAAGALAVALRTDGYTGPLTIVGDEPHSPYERPPLSKGVLRGDAAFHESAIRPREWYAQAGVELHLGRRVLTADMARRSVTLDDGRDLGFGTLVFATGLTPRRLGVPGGELPGVHVLRTEAECRAIAAAAGTASHAVVVGAGLLGLEVAAALRSLGRDVTVLEAAPRPLMRVMPAVVADHVAGLHRARGVRLDLGVAVAAFVGDDRLRSVLLTDGTALPADLAVVAVGSTPNDQLARAAGLDVRDGIVVDGHCRTSLPFVHAIGDVARHRSARFDREWRLESWQNAQEQAAICARAILGVEPPPARIPTFWTDQYDTTIQFVGVTDATTRTELHGDPSSGAFVVHCRVGDELVGVVGVNRPRDVRQARVAIESGRPLVDPRRG